MPTIDRTRAINLYKGHLIPSEYHFQAGGYVSKCLDSLGVGADTNSVTLDSNDPGNSKQRYCYVRTFSKSTA